MAKVVFFCLFGFGFFFFFFFFFAFFFFMIRIELYIDLEKEEVKDEGHFRHDLLRLNKKQGRWWDMWEETGGSPQGVWVKFLTS